jgi:hypothetical protein
LTNTRPRICVVGGGSAGWITLSYLAATIDADFTIIHSEEIDIVGVGESTTPTIKHVAETVGISELDWIRGGRATIKYGINFTNWNSVGSTWFHSFDDLIPADCFHRTLLDNGKELFASELTSVDYYLAQYGQDWHRFNRTQGAQQFLLDHKLSPFNQHGESNVSRYPGYAYHVNAFEFGNTLRRHTPANRYREIKQKIRQVVTGEQGVDHLLLEDGTEIRADLFFDCSGFHRLLISQLSEWKDFDGLINDSAMWGPIKDVFTDVPATEAAAQDVGWIWATPTYNQIGSGYVYSSDHISEDQAHAVITRFWKDRGHHWEPIRSARFRAGHFAPIGVKNVISNGLCQSFVEPLEATSIMVTCHTVVNFVNLYRRNLNTIDHKLVDLHARTMSRFLTHMKEFIVNHYRLSSRRDTQYWRDVTDEQSVKAVSDVIARTKGRRWLNSGETAYNQFNWASMLLGYDKTYANPVAEIAPDRMQEYLEYTQQLIANYERLLRNNIPIAEFLHEVHR